MGLTINRVTHRLWRQACRKCNREYAEAKKKYRRHRSLVEKLFGYCPCCERWFRYSVKTKRRASAYCEEAKNWLTACKECHEEDDAYFADLWDQYYSSIQEEI